MVSFFFRLVYFSSGHPRIPRLDRDSGWSPVGRGITSNILDGDPGTSPLDPQSSSMSPRTEGCLRKIKGSVHGGGT